MHPELPPELAAADDAHKAYEVAREDRHMAALQLAMQVSDLVADGRIALLGATGALRDTLDIFHESWQAYLRARDDWHEKVADLKVPPPPPTA